MPCRPWSGLGTWLGAGAESGLEGQRNQSSQLQLARHLSSPPMQINSSRTRVCGPHWSSPLAAQFRPRVQVKVFSKEGLAV